MDVLIRYITAQKVEIDIHQMTRDQAKRYLEQFLNRVNGNVREVAVIHGCHQGTVLQQMVRTGLKHKRIKGKVQTLNQGVTILIL